MDFPIWQRLVALMIAIVLHASVFLSLKTEEQGVNQSGLSGMEFVFAPPPSPSTVESAQEVEIEEVETIDIEQEVEVIEVEQEVSAVEVVEVEPKPEPKVEKTFQVATKPKELKPTKPKVETLPPKETKQVVNNEVKKPAKSEHASSQQASTAQGVTSVIGTTQKAKTNYKSIVAAILQKHKSYPPRAKKRRQEGIVTVKFTIQRSGDVVNYQVTNSSGFKILDKAVEKMIKKAAPLPPFPSDLRENQLTFELPVEFYIRS